MDARCARRLTVRRKPPREEMAVGAGPAGAELVYADARGQQIKMLGSCRWCTPCTRIGIGQIIDELVPIRDGDAERRAGVEAMVCNRPSWPVVHVQDWACSWAVEEVLGIRACLERRKLGAASMRSPRDWRRSPGWSHSARSASSASNQKMHWDMTALAARRLPNRRGLRPPPTGTKDRREDLLQIQAGIAAAGDGGIPVSPMPQRRGGRDLPGHRGDERPEEDRGDEEVPAGRRLQADQLRQRAAIGGAASSWPPRQALRQGRRDGRLRPGQGHRGRRVAGRDQHKRNTSSKSWAAGMSWKTISRSDSNSKRKSDSRYGCAASSCTLVPAPTPPSPTAPGSSPAPKKTWTAWCRAWAAGLPRRAEDVARIKQISLARKVGPYLRYSIGTAPAGGPGNTSTGQVSRRQPVPPRRGPSPADLAGHRQRRTRQTRPHLVVDQAAIDAETATDGGTPCSTTSTPPRPQPRCAALQSPGSRRTPVRQPQRPLAVAPMFLNTTADRRADHVISPRYVLPDRTRSPPHSPETKLDGLYNGSPPSPPAYPHHAG